MLLRHPLKTSDIWMNQRCNPLLDDTQFIDRPHHWKETSTIENFVTGLIPHLLRRPCVARLLDRRPICMTTLIVGHTQLVTEQFDPAICDQMSGPIHGCEEDQWVFTPQQEVDIDSLMIFQRLPCFQEPGDREMEEAAT